MKHRRPIARLVALSLLAALIYPAQSEGGSKVATTKLDVAYISAHPYEVTPLKQAWNTILYVFAPAYLAEVWPSDAYDLHTVRSFACDSAQTDSEIIFGNKLTFIHQPKWMVEIPKVVGGVEVDVNKAAGLADICALLNATTETEGEMFQKLLVAYQAMNSPADGTWKVVENDAEIPDDLIPLLQGEFAEWSPGIPELFPTWRSDEKGKLLRWSAIAESNPTFEVGANHVWVYSTPAEPGASKYFVTYEPDAELDNNSETWGSPNSTFKWISPPKANGREGSGPILWGAPNARDDVPDSWYLVMSRALPYLTPDYRFEKFLERGPYVGFGQAHTASD